MSQPAKSERLGFLDVTRGIAAAAVAVQHGAEHVSPAFKSWSLRHVNFGAFGVVAFFLVSGFVIPYSLERSGSLKRFWIGRFFRLFPLYWSSLAAVVLLDRLGFPEIPATQRAHLAKFVLANATMFQEAFRIPHAIGVYWTLSLEMIFYVLCALLFALRMNKRSMLWAWLGLTSMLVACVAFAVLFHRTLPAGRIGLIASALVGTVLFRVYTGDVPLRRLTEILFATAVVFAVGFYLRFALFPAPNRDIDWTFTAVAVSWAAAYGFVLLAYLARDRSFPSSLRWLGKVSYSLYVVHPLVIDTLPKLHNGAAWIALYLAVTLIVCGASYSLIEQPSIDLGRRLAGRLTAAKWVRPAQEPTP